MLRAVFTWSPRDVGQRSTLGAEQPIPGTPTGSCRGWGVVSSRCRGRRGTTAVAALAATGGALVPAGVVGAGLDPVLDLHLVVLHLGLVVRLDLGVLDLGLGVLDLGSRGARAPPTRRPGRARDRRRRSSARRWRRTGRGRRSRSRRRTGPSPSARWSSPEPTSSRWVATPEGVAAPDSSVSAPEVDAAGVSTTSDADCGGVSVTAAVAAAPPPTTTTAAAATVSLPATPAETTLARTAENRSGTAGSWHRDGAVPCARRAGTVPGAEPPVLGVGSRSGNPDARTPRRAAQGDPDVHAGARGRCAGRSALAAVAVPVAGVGTVTAGVPGTPARGHPRRRRRRPTRSRGAGGRPRRPPCRAHDRSRTHGGRRRRRRRRGSPRPQASRPRGSRPRAPPAPAPRGSPAPAPPPRGSPAEASPPPALPRGRRHQAWRRPAPPPRSVDRDLGGLDLLRGDVGRPDLDGLGGLRRARCP